MYIERTNKHKSTNQFNRLTISILMGLGLALITLLLLTTTNVSADPDNLYVDGTGGNDSGDCKEPGNPCATIGYAISQSIAGDVINVAQGSYDENINLSFQITIMGGFEAATWTRDIQLYETIIDGNQNGSVISVSGTSERIELDGLTVTGGLGTEGGTGGGISSGQADLIIQNSQIISNTTTFDGGGIYLGEGTLTITDTLISENTAGGCCGGIHVGNTSTATISDSDITMNKAGYGGGVGVFSGSSVTIQRSKITENDTDVDLIDTHTVIGVFDGDERTAGDSDPQSIGLFNFIYPYLVEHQRGLFCPGRCADAFIVITLLFASSPAISTRKIG